MLPAVWAPSPDFKEAKGVIANYVEVLTKAAPPRVVALSSMGANRTSGLGMITALSLLEQGFRDFASPVAVVRAGGFFENFLYGLHRRMGHRKVEVLNDISPLPGTAGFGTVLRSLHTDFLDEWSAKRDEARRERDRLKQEIVSTTQAGRPDATLLTAGQTAGGIKDIPPVSEIMRRLVAETEAALRKAADLSVAI
jgi:hypothetical protein